MSNGNFVTSFNSAALSAARGSSAPLEIGTAVISSTKPVTIVVLKTPSPSQYVSRMPASVVGGGGGSPSSSSSSLPDYGIALVVVLPIVFCALCVAVGYYEYSRRVNSDGWRKAEPSARDQQAAASEVDKSAQSRPTGTGDASAMTMDDIYIADDADLYPKRVATPLSMDNETLKANRIKLLESLLNMSAGNDDGEVELNYDANMRSPASASAYGKSSPQSYRSAGSETSSSVTSQYVSPTGSRNINFVPLYDNASSSPRDVRLARQKLERERALRRQQMDGSKQYRAHASGGGGGSGGSRRSASPSPYSPSGAGSAAATMGMNDGRDSRGQIYVPMSPRLAKSIDKFYANAADGGKSPTSQQASPRR